MSPKHSIKSKTHHHRRHSYKPGSIGSSSRSQRGRSRSRSSRRARSSSPLLRSRSRINPPSRFGSHSRSRPRKLRNRDFPIYIPSSEQHTHAIPKIIAEALRQQSQEHNEALAATNSGHRLPTPPPDPTPNTQGGTRTPAPGLKRRPSSSPAAAKARRRRRRRPRPRQQSVTSERDDPILPPQPEPTPSNPAAPYSFFGIIRAKAEKEKREEAAKRKREEERKRKRKQAAANAKKCRDDRYGDDTSKKTAKIPTAEEASIPLPRRSNSAPPLSRSPVQGYPQDCQYDEEQPRTASQRRHNRHKQQQQQRRKKHHRRSGEQHHRRQKRRSSRYAMRDFFASLRRKLGNFFRLTLPAPAQPPPPPAQRLDYSTSPPAREPGAQNYGSEGRASEQQRRGRKRRTPQMQQQQQQQQPLPYFMHGGRSPADSWHSRLSRPRSTRRFTATVESAPGSRAASPRTTRVPRGGMGTGMGTGPGVPRFSQQSSGSTISIIARRFMGPFLSEPNSEATTTLDGAGGGALGPRRLSWRSYKLLTAGSRPATPPSSRNVSPEGRGRSKSREEMSIPGAYRSSSTSMGLRNPYDASSPADPDRRSRSASPPYRVASPEYGGLADLFATPQRVSSPVSSAYVRISSSDYGLQRLFTTPPAGSGSNSNFGLRRLFGE
ncbi:hypothetical protein F4801DRAFT_386037 [Xylaria longipes]|nr:hypothetical protein F4801DRAFT_386037 [Xylaria longipes]